MAKVLGKGLGALIKSYNKDVESSIHDYLSIDMIIMNKHQPRQSFNNKDMNHLVESIKNKGIIQPLSVRQINKNLFELIAGERRYRAAVKLGLKSVPVHIMKIKDEAEMMEIALIENIQRINLNPIEEAEAFAVLRDKYNFSQLKIAQTIAKSRSEVANKLRLLQLPQQVKNSLKLGHIYYAHARALLAIKNPSKMLLAYNMILNNKLNARQTEQLVSKYNNQKEKIKKPISKLEMETNKINKQLPKYANVILQSSKKGILKLKFNNKDELDKLISILIKS